jgi:uridine phosphorylase
VAARLSNPVIVNDDRSLRTITGDFGGNRVTVSAFGMGAPIAAIVMHELASIGVRRFLRLGTAMALQPAALGELLVADAAVRHESTSGTYVPEGYPAAAAHDLSAALRSALRNQPTPWRAGLIASYDGFYTEMFAIDEHRRPQIEQEMLALRDLNVLGVDMETATLLAVARSFDVQAGALCAVTVDWASHRRMEAHQRSAIEAKLIDVGLSALTDTAASEHANGPDITIVKEEQWEQHSDTSTVPGNGSAR